MDGLLAERPILLLFVLLAVGTAFGAIEAVSESLNEFGNSAILEVRNDLAFMTRRVRNLCLLNGVSPKAVEKAGDLHDVADEAA